MAYLADICRGERPHGIAGYSNGAAAAMLVAALRESGDEAFQSVGVVMSFAGPTSETMRRHVRANLGPPRSRITIPAIMFGSRHDAMLAGAGEMAGDLFEQYELAVQDERRPYANHALPDRIECYAPIVKFLSAQNV